MRCSDSISSPRTGVEAILTELGPGKQNRRYAASSHKMNKWIYIATVLDPRNKLDKCFTAGDAMTPTEVKAL